MFSMQCVAGCFHSAPTSCGRQWQQAGSPNEVMSLEFMRASDICSSSVFKQIQVEVEVDAK